MSTVHRGRAAPAPPVVARLDGLLERSAHGDMAAFAALYAQTASRTFGLAVRVLRDWSLAEDAVQEAYLTIWRTSARFDPRQGTSLGWIFMIVHRSAVDHLRSAESRSARDSRHFREGSLLGPRDSDPTHDPTHDLAHASLEAGLVRAALSRLPDRQRQALQLAYFDGHSYSEVAELLDVPLGTAKTRIRDGLMRLRRSVEIREIQAARCEL